MNRRLKQIEQAINRSEFTSREELVDITDHVDQVLDKVYGPDPSRGQQRILVTGDFLALLKKVYGDQQD